MLEIPTNAAWLLLLTALPICLWVIYTDLKDMKIRNKAVLGLLVVYAVVGFIALPLDAYLWRFAHFGVVLIIGFFFSSIGAFGAGDAKFAAAMALFIAFPDAGKFMMLLGVTLLVAFTLHRIAGRIPLIRRATPSWASWDVKKKFPMGTALGASLAMYLALGVAYGA